MIAALLVLCQQAHWWSARVDASLNRAPGRKEFWVRYLNGVKPEERPSVNYLMEDLPYSDLLGLDPKKLTENVKLALKVKKEIPWVAKLPGDVFNDAVLPHSNVGEPRDSMRSVFHDQYLSIAKQAHSPGEAALALNKTLFKDYHVSYNTKRLRTDQSPKETIAQGIATCTGLSIMLVDACRAIGVPARIAGIHSWPVTGGNHTWVEVWDNGWHFVGAAEPDPQGLDHAWFTASAAKAIKTAPFNAIWAVTYRQTGDHFPASWDDDSTYNAVNVTDRYAPSTDVAQSASQVRLMVDVTWHGERVNADAEILDSVTRQKVGAGVCLGPGADINHFLTVMIPVKEKVIVKVTYQGHTAEKTAQIDEDTVLRLDLS